LLKYIIFPDFIKVNGKIKLDALMLFSQIFLK